MAPELLAGNRRGCRKILTLSRLESRRDAHSAFYAIRGIYNEQALSGNRIDRWYPTFSNWLLHRVIPTLGDRTRCVIVARDRQRIAGFAIVKHDETEKKLCSLVVSPSARLTGVSNALMDESLLWLNTDRPTATVGSDVGQRYLALLQRYNFRRLREIQGLYRSGVGEWVFNSDLQT